MMPDRERPDIESYVHMGEGDLDQIMDEEDVQTPK